MSKTTGIPETIPNIDFGNQGGDDDLDGVATSDVRAIKAVEGAVDAQLRAEVADARESARPLNDERAEPDFGEQGSEDAVELEPTPLEVGGRRRTAPVGSGPVDFGSQGADDELEPAAAKAPAKKAAAKKAPARKPAPAKKAAAKKAR